MHFDSISVATLQRVRFSEVYRGSIRSIIVLIFAYISLAIAGCSSLPHFSSDTSTAFRSGVNGVNTAGKDTRGSSQPKRLVSSAAYQRATLLFGQRDYAAAASTIDSLLAGPQRSTAERTFLLRQKAICQRALSKPTKPVSFPGDVAPTPKTWMVARRKHAASVGDFADCGPRALLLVCEHEHVPADLAHLRQAAGTEAAKGGTSLEGLEHAARSVGFAAQGIQVDRDALANLPTAAIAWVDGNHYIAVLGVKRSLLGAAHDTARVHDPNNPHQNGEEVIPVADLLNRSGGVLLTLTRLTPSQK